MVMSDVLNYVRIFDDIGATSVFHFGNSFCARRQLNQVISKHVRQHHSRGDAATIDGLTWNRLIWLAVSFNQGFERGFDQRANSLDSR